MQTLGKSVDLICSDAVGLFRFWQSQYSIRVNSDAVLGVYDVGAGGGVHPFKFLQLFLKSASLQVIQLPFCLSGCP